MRKLKRRMVKGVKIIFTKNADNFIARYCDGGSVVVTQDRELGWRCREKKVQVCDPDMFFDPLTEEV
jgi:uncharacterized protein YaiI (UPF0178 family)